MRKLMLFFGLLSCLFMVIGAETAFGQRGRGGPVGPGGRAVAPGGARVGAPAYNYGRYGSYPGSYRRPVYAPNYGRYNYGYGRYYGPSWGVGVSLGPVYASPYYGSRYYSSPVYVYPEPVYIYQTPTVVTTAPITTGVRTYESFYSGPGSTSADQATLRMILPMPDARVWIENQLMSTTGIERVITSPPLDRSKSYVYHIRASWIENGREMTRESQVGVRAGQSAFVNFTSSVAPPVPRTN